MNSRDRRVLAWIAEQYAVRFDHLRRLLSQEPGHKSERFAPGAGGVSDSDVLQVIKRWERDPAWAVYKRFYVDTPGWIWTMPYGVDVLASQNLIPRYARHFPKESTFEHLHYVNYVRLDIEARHPDYRWVSERSIRKLLGKREEGDDLAHIPDGQIWLDDRRAVAVEVELSPKNEGDYDAIFDELLITGVMLPDGSAFKYKTVWYFVSSANDVHVQARRMVGEARERLAEEYRRFVQVIELETLVQRYDASATKAAAPVKPESQP
jgi:hypothetical protein